MADKITFFSIENPEEILIPYYSGTGLHAGFPSPAMDYLQESIDLNKLLIKNQSATFIIEVVGDSMIDVFIADPSKLIIDRSVRLRNNDIVIALVNNDFMVRTYTKTNGIITLLPQNKKGNYQPTIIKDDMQFELWGVVTTILINPRNNGL